MSSPRILLVHLISNGDCLMATAVARQIKLDFPGCHLTWAISYKCRQVIENNPFVDAIWSVEYGPHELPHDDVWYRTKNEAERRKRNGEFDRIFYTQIFPENFNNSDGTTRTSIFRSYPGRITVPVQPTMQLSPHEVERVRQFAQKHALGSYRHIVLFECTPASNQSSMTLESATRLAHRLAEQRRDTAFVISSHRSFPPVSPAIIDGSELTFRENAELSKYCTLLLGCSSGITWLLTSNWAKKLPTIQILRRSRCWYGFASVKYDHAFWNLDTDHILETDLHRDDDLIALLSRYFAQGSFDGLPAVDFLPSTDQILDLVTMLRGPVEVRRVLRNFVERNPSVPVDVSRFLRRAALHRLKIELKAIARHAITIAQRDAVTRPHRILSRKDAR